MWNKSTSTKFMPNAKERKLTWQKATNCQEPSVWKLLYPSELSQALDHRLQPKNQTLKSRKKNKQSNHLSAKPTLQAWIVLLRQVFAYYVHNRKSLWTLPPNHNPWGLLKLHFWSDAVRLCPRLPSSHLFKQDECLCQTNAYGKLCRTQQNRSTISKVPAPSSSAFNIAEIYNPFPSKELRTRSQLTTGKTYFSSRTARSSDLITSSQIV